MRVEQDIPLAPLTTFRMGPRARYLIEIDTSNHLPEAFAFIKERSLPFTVLGGGSNTIFTEDSVYEGVVLRMSIRDFVLITEDDAGAKVRVGAGESWDSVVERAVGMGLSGIEALSAIPGSAGATPIQNVGAYGAEIADVLESVDVYEPATGRWLQLSKDECGFTYRDSIFRRSDRYVITDVTMRLSKSAPEVPNYPGVHGYFEERGVTAPTLSDIREAITAIRRTKLPDPTDIASVGSFFKNPFVSQEIADTLRAEFERPVMFDMGEGKYKVGAGWLIDTLGLKGKSFGNITLYKNNALVLTNTGGATYKELAHVIADVQKKVRDRFGIELEPEPVFV